MTEQPPKRNGLNGMPSWVRITSYVGFPIIVALIFLGMFTGQVGSPITEAVELGQENNRLLREHEMENEVQTRLLRSICRSLATTEFTQAECDR